MLRWPFWIVRCVKVFCDGGGCCYDFKWLENHQQSKSKNHLFRGYEPLKNASYPTSIVFKGLIKSRVEEELSIKDQLLNTTVYPVLIYYVTRQCMSKRTVQDCAWVSILCMRLCRAVRHTSKERKSIEGNKSVKEIVSIRQEHAKSIRGKWVGKSK